MRDLHNNITAEEGDHYFRDPAFETPFPLAVRHDATIMDVHSKDQQVPTRISLNIRLDTVSQVGFNHEFAMKDPAQDLDQDTWTSDFVVDDDSCGTLDYSVDTIEEEKLLKVQQALTRVVYGPPASEPSSPITLESCVMDKDDKMNDDLLDEYGIHGRNKNSEDECFGIPIGWLTTLLQGLKR